MAKSTAGPWLTEKGLELLGGWARRGLTDDQIASSIGVSRSTLGRWKKQFAAIRDALSEGKEIADTNVENALYKRAIGFTQEEVTSYRDKKTGEMVVSKRVVKQVAPDVTAMVFWLKNRRPDLWRDRPVDTSETAETQVASYLDALTAAVTDPDPGEDGDPDESG